MTKKQKERLTSALAAWHERPDNRGYRYRVEQLARELMRVPKGHKDESLPINNARAATLTEIFRLDEGTFGLECLWILSYKLKPKITCDPAIRADLVEAVRSATLTNAELNTYYSLIEELLAKRK